MPSTVEELKEEGILEDVVNSKMVQKYLAYRDLADGIDPLKEDDVMYEQLVDGVEGRVRVKKGTVKQVLEAFVKEVETNTEALKSEEEGYDRKKKYD